MRNPSPSESAGPNPDGRRGGIDRDSGSGDSPSASLSDGRTRSAWLAWASLLLFSGIGGCLFNSPIETAYLESQGPDTTTPLPEIPPLELGKPMKGQLDCPAGNCQQTYRVVVDGFGTLRITVDSSFDEEEDIGMRITVLDPVGSVIGQQPVDSGKPTTLKGDVTTGSHFVLLQSLGGAVEYSVNASFDRRGSAMATPPPPESYEPKQQGAVDHSKRHPGVPTKLGAGFIRDPKVDFTKYKTFAFAQNPAKTMAEAAPGQYVGNPFLDAEIQRAIRSELMLWGYQLAAEEEADVLVASHVGSQSRSVYAIDYVTYDVPYEALFNRWSLAAGMIVSPAIYRRGTLVIDFIDRSSTNVIWHGWSNRPISGREDDRTIVRSVVNEILDQYPKERS